MASEKIKGKKNRTHTGGHLRTVTKRSGVDMGFLSVTIILLVLGLLMVFSASYPSANYKYNDGLYFIRRQAIWAALGFGVMLFTIKVDYHLYRKFAAHIGIVTVVLLLIVLASTPINGARRWLGVGALTIQPSELAKVSIIIYFAATLSATKEKIRKFNYLIRHFIVLGAVLYLLILEPHMSVCIIIGCVAVIMFLVAGANPKHFLLIGAVLVPVVIVVAFSADYRVDRLATYFDPFIDPKGKGWQIIQSL